MSYDGFILSKIEKASPKIGEILKAEIERQDKNIELIASENYPSDAVKAACGSVMMNKYTEGYSPNKSLGRKGRYYGGCENFDKLEEYGVEVFQNLFKTDYYFNLQPHSGSNANFIAYASVLNIGDRLLAMDMSSGSHLTHSSPVSFVSKMYDVYTYGTDENGFLNYENILKIAKEVKPKAIICGASAYSREMNFKAFRRIADEVNAYLIADIAHVSTLCAWDILQSPFGVADIVSFTTHKIFRGPRGGVVACKPELANKIDSACFPFTQGGSIQNNIMGKILAAEEACKPEYKKYLYDVIINSQAMAGEFLKLGYDVTTGGTDNHMFLLDFSKTHPNITGQQVQDACDKYNITLNKNCVPNEKRSPKETSGVRIGTPAETTKGKTAEDFRKIANQIDEIIKNIK